MKLNSITVGNFKNLEETTIDLNSMVAIVSTNNYGKSNLLEAIRFGFDFISASPKGRANMMRWTRGIPLVPSLANKDFVFSLEFDSNTAGEYRFIRYSFSFAWINDNNTGACITDENIEARATESVRYTSYLKRKEGMFRAGKNVTGFRKANFGKEVLAIDVLSSIDNIELGDTISQIKELTYRICDTLELSRSFQPTPIEFDFNDNSGLAFDDDDIPKALSVLQKENPDKYELFIETIYDLFPEFKKIELKSYALKEKENFQLKTVMFSSQEDDSQNFDIPYHIKDEVYKLIIDSQFLNQPISMEYMSTGTKRLIWLIASAIFGSNCGTNIIGVDEIETSIHPKMIKNLLESINDILQDTSMIVTSHSPYLIQYLKPESIYVGLPNNNGVASFKKIQHTKIKSLAKRTKELGTSIGEYLFELMAGDEDDAAILSAYLGE